MLKRLSIYYLCFVIMYLPVFRAHAFVPVLAYAFNTVATQVVRYVGTEFIISTAARGFAANDPYHASKGVLSKSKYLSFLKGKGKAISYIAGGLISAGFIVGDSITVEDESLVGDKTQEEGFYWKSSSEVEYSSSNLAAEAYCASFSPSSCTSIQLHESSDDRYTYYRVSDTGFVYPTSPIITYRYLCQDNSSASTCADNYEAFGREVTDDELFDNFLNWLLEQPAEQQQMAFSEEQGTIHPDIVSSLVMPSQPVMPDSSALPSQSEPLWVYADYIADGVAQSSDSSDDYYVPSDFYADAEYLYNDVVGQNPELTHLNATGQEISGNLDTNPDTSTPSIPNPLPVIGPMTATEYKSIQDSYFDNAANSLPSHDFSDSEDKINQVMNDFIDNSVNIDVPTWDFNPFGYFTFGGGSCIKFSFDLSIGGNSKSIVLDAHCVPYEDFVRPTLEWSLYLMTALNIYMIFTRTVRSI